MNILDAMLDPKLLGGEFSASSWDAWRALLGGFYGVEGIDRGLFHDLTQREPEGPWRELWLAIGRRGGKSRAAGLIATFEAAFQDHRAKLAPGEVATVMVVAADRKQARTVHRYIRGLLLANPMLRRMVIRENEEVIELDNRSVIEIGTASFRSIRGYSISCAILDEVAFWQADGANPDAEVLAGIRPALATLDGKLVALSSPYARKGVLWNAYRKHFGGDDRRVLVAKAPTATMNPTIDPRVIEDALAEDPAAAAAEWLAEFRSDVETFVSREVVEACVDVGVREQPRAEGIAYRAFVDPSGGSADSFTLGVAHAEGDAVVLDCVRERRPPFNPEAVVEEFAAVVKSYGLTSVTGDRYGGQWVRQVFERHGIEYKPAERSKSEIYVDVLPLLNSGRARLLDEQRLVAQLVGLERRTARGGRESVDHAPGGHDDLINAGAGALWLAARPAAQPFRWFVGMMGSGGTYIWTDEAGVTHKEHVEPVYAGEPVTSPFDLTNPWRTL